MADLRQKSLRVHTLARVDSLPIGNDQDEIRAFMVVRDEMLRLPSTLDHYRKIGVARFFVTDNGSTDGTKEFLLDQKDCHIFVTSDSYSEAGYGLRWQNALLNEYGMNHWCLAVDADEWFIYPGYERVPLVNLTEYLDRSGAQGMFSFLLDMYGPGSTADAIPTPHASLLDACGYFDSEYEWQRRPRIPVIEPPRFPEYNVFGGPRLRFLFPNFKNYHYLMRALWRSLDFLPLPLPAPLKTPPTLPKIPLVHWRPGTRYEHPHATTPIKLSEVTGVLLHFKFLEDFYTRVSTELNRKEHRAHGIWASELERYLAKLQKNPTLSFHYAGSVAYESSEQLVRLGLLREDHDWKQIRETAAIDSRARRGEGLAPLRGFAEP
jgi:glycosyltransferase involved in cell wall biosynthesis